MQDRDLQGRDSPPGLVLRSGLEFTNGRLLFQEADKFSHPRRMIRPSACRDHCSINHCLRIDELRTCRFDVWLYSWIRGSAPALQYPTRGQYQSSMAKLSDGFLVFKEMSDDLL